MPKAQGYGQFGANLASRNVTVWYNMIPFNSKFLVRDNMQLLYVMYIYVNSSLWPVLDQQSLP